MKPALGFARMRLKYKPDKAVVKIQEILQDPWHYAEEKTEGCSSAAMRIDIQRPAMAENGCFREVTRALTRICRAAEESPADVE
jgi:hypothetical protein